MLSRFFKIAENNTTIGRELQAGLTTFAAMAYILAVNPDILAATGMDRAALVTATAVGAAFSTVLMALLTNYPLALAPGMGINAYFAYSVCIGMGVPWQGALAMVFVNGVLFLALSLTGIREKIIKAIPYQLKIAITCGIGLFIAFIGLKNAGLVVAHPATLVTHGDFGAPGPLLALGGIFLMLFLVARRTPGAIVLTVFAVAAVGLLLPDGQGGTITRLPDRIVDTPASLAPIALKLDFTYITQNVWAAIPIILTLLFVDMFDNIGTLIGVTQRAGFLNKDGELPRIGRALVADSTAAIASSLVGTSTVVSYIESASGVEAGGRTGLTSMTTAALFLVALFFTPLILAVPSVATAPALVVVGVFMMQSARELDLKDFPWAAAAVLTILVMPLTFSIATGIGVGLVTAALLMLLLGRRKETTVVTVVLAVVFLLEFLRTPIGHLIARLTS
jgi:AGZA family xanthine/uracil permease-like MFS transporter